MNVLFAKEVRDYLRDLEEILLEKEYFSFPESAFMYVQELIFDIQETLPLRPKHNAPAYFDRYGKEMYYCTFPKNKHTTWYVFFSIYQTDTERVFLIKYISNNHVTGQFLL